MTSTTKPTSLKCLQAHGPTFSRPLTGANKKLGTAVRLGAISTNKFQLMDYRDFYRSLFIGVRQLVGSLAIPADKKVGIILAAHGSSTTNRLYDVSNIVNNPIRNNKINAYFALRGDGRFTPHPRPA